MGNQATEYSVPDPLRPAPERPSTTFRIPRAPERGRLLRFFLLAACACCLRPSGFFCVCPTTKTAARTFPPSCRRQKADALFTGT